MTDAERAKARELAEAVIKANDPDLPWQVHDLASAVIGLTDDWRNLVQMLDAAVARLEELMEKTR